MKMLSLLIIGLILGFAIGTGLPALAEQEGPYGSFPRSGLPGERYDDGAGVQHYRDGTWRFGPLEKTPDRAPC